jgi:hypothetical protein
MSSSIRMPITVASRKGISAIANQATDQRIILTSHGRTVAVVDGPERLDEDLRKIRESARAVTESAAEAVLQRRPAHLNLEELCARLQIDVWQVRLRAKLLASK